MKKIIYVLLLIFVQTAAHAEIQTIYSMRELEESAGAIDYETLILFDIDQTLVMADDPAFQRPNFIKHKPLVRKLVKPWGPQLKLIALNLMVLRDRSHPVEVLTPMILQSLRETDAPMIALTNTLTGEISQSIGTPVQTRRAFQLLEVGIDFSYSFPYLGEVSFSEFGKRMEGYPTFKKGILCANGERKDEVLLAFLKRVDWKPKKIVFVEDTRKNLEQMEETLEGLGIEFVGLHYRGADQFVAEEITADALEAKWWMVEKEAKEILAHTEKVGPALRTNLWLSSERELLGDGVNYNFPILATSTEQGGLTARVVGCPDLDEEGNAYIFTHKDSRKAKQMQENNQVVLHFWLHQTKRQISIEGTAIEETGERVTEAWKRGKRQRKLRFLATHPEITLGSLEDLKGRIKQLEEKFPEDIPLPRDFVCYRITPDRFIFTSIEEGQYQKRLVSFHDGAGDWKTKKIWP